MFSCEAFLCRVVLDVWPSHFLALHLPLHRLKALLYFAHDNNNSRQFSLTDPSPNLPQIACRWIQVNGAGHKTPKTKLVFAPMPRESSPLRRANSFSTIQSSGLFRSTVSSALLSGFLVFLFFDNTFLLKVKLFKPRPSAAYLFSFNVRTPQFILNMAVEKSGFWYHLRWRPFFFLGSGPLPCSLPDHWAGEACSKLCGKIWIPCFEALHGPSHTWELWYADPLRMNGHSGVTGPKTPVTNMDKICIPVVPHKAVAEVSKVGNL